MTTTPDVYRSMERNGRTAQTARRAEPGERLPAEVRRARILASIEKAGFVSISGLAAELGVSGMTIRRDVSILEGRGALERTHGGAIAEAHPPGVSFDEIEPAFEHRMRRQGQQKAAIARAAAALVGRGESIGLDVGTSILALVAELSQRSDLRVFTNNLRAAMQMAQSGSEVYVPGGRVRDAESSIVGSRAVEELRSRFLDRVFVGVSGFDANGFYDYSLEDSDVKRAFMASANTVVVLCDSSKFGRRALARVAPLEEADIVVTDAAPPPELASALERGGVRVIVAHHADKLLRLQQ